MTLPPKRRFRPLTLLSDLLLNFALLGLGAGFYYHFLVAPLGPFELNPVVINLFGSLQTAVWLIAGLPFLVGFFGLAGVLFRLLKTWRANRES